MCRYERYRLAFQVLFKTFFKNLNNCSLTIIFMKLIEKKKIKFELDDKLEDTVILEDSPIALVITPLSQ